jgi:hypothetical protein
MAFLSDGYQTLISMSAAPNTNFREKEVQPPGLDGGGMIDTTTMRNTRFRTRQPKHLVTADDITLHVQYDPDAYNTVLAIIQEVQTLTVTFPDGKQLNIDGFLDTFKPVSHREGEFPTAEMKFVMTNQTAEGVETGPSLT